MKNLLVILCIAVAAVSAAPANTAQVLRYDNDPYDNNSGKYRFAFEQTDGTRHEQRAEVRNQGLENEFLAVFGEYSWVAPNGVRFIVKYQSDDNGYNSELEEGPPGAPLEISNALLG